jgi:hypothetical protein
MHVDAEAADTEERSREPLALLYGADHPALRRGPDNNSSKENPGAAITKSIDTEERLPGCKDGLGVFPPGSDSVRTMLALELRGSRDCFSYSGTHLISQESHRFKGRPRMGASAIATRKVRKQKE